MRYKLTIPPATQPLTSYDEVKRHLRRDDDDYQDIIEEIIVEVERELEETTGRILSPRTCSITFYDYAGQYVVPSCQSVTTVLDGSGNSVDYLASYLGDSAIITPGNTVYRNTGTMTVTFAGGTDAGKVRRLVKEMVAFKFRYAGDEAAEYPVATQRAIDKLVRVRL